MANVATPSQPTRPSLPADRHCPQLFSAAVLSGLAQRQQGTRSSFSTTAAAASTSAKVHIPKGAWDSHMHVVDPDRYQLASDAAYRPHTHTVSDALEYETSVGIENVVFVQPSIYGFDNSCLLDAMRELGPSRSRGVIAFDPSSTSSQQLNEWHQLGVRSVRVNIQSTIGPEGVDMNHLSTMLFQYADAIRHLGWVVQLYVPLYLMEDLETILPKLNIKLCIDHLGYPNLSKGQTEDPYGMRGFESLMRLLQQGDTYVKLSAPYRMSQKDGYQDLAPLAKEVIRLHGGKRVVFATDWPHTRFEGLDIRPWIQLVLGWCEGDQRLADRLFKENAEDLWDVEASTASSTAAS